MQYSRDKESCFWCMFHCWNLLWWICRFFWARYLPSPYSCLHKALKQADNAENETSVFSIFYIFNFIHIRHFLIFVAVAFSLFTINWDLGSSKLYTPDIMASSRYLVSKYSPLLLFCCGFKFEDALRHAFRQAWQINWFLEYDTLFVISLRGKVIFDPSLVSLKMTSCWTVWSSLRKWAVRIVLLG